MPKSRLSAKNEQQQSSNLIQYEEEKNGGNRFALDSLESDDSDEKMSIALTQQLNAIREMS